MFGLRDVIALAGDYRFTATVAFVVLFVSLLKLLGADFDLVIAILLLGCATAVYEIVNIEVQVNRETTASGERRTLPQLRQDRPAGWIQNCRGTAHARGDETAVPRKAKVNGMSSPGQRS